jgi:glycogen debranching enzyme GlgX
VIAEFKTMVRTLHAAGLEVILDVVFNHTAETDEFGPTLSFRGIDNQSYYLLRPGNPAAYENYSGCGNTFNLTEPRVLQLVMDALRYWVGVMHVDGFRFDLAAALARDSAFLAAVRQDPLLQNVKLIAEPWDMGPDGYRLGRFLPGWSEWNDRFRDDVRAFWLTGEVGVGALAQRLSGSSELFKGAGRAPQASVNFLTAHDGFTLRDLVSYQNKHNELNGEQQSRRTRPQSVVELRRRRRKRRPGSARKAPESPAARAAGHAARRPGRPHAAGRRRTRPHARRQQQRLLPGQRDDLARLAARRRRADRLLAGLIACASASRNCAG